MAELDLSLSDALTDNVPQPGPEGQVERDFVAQLEAETFDDQVKETVGKTDFIPLLDNDDSRADAVTAVENGQQETHGVQKPGFSQPGEMSMNVEVGAAPLQTERPRSIAEPEPPTPPAGLDVPMQPEPQAPYSPIDLTAGALGNSWTEEAGCPSAHPPFTPSVSMMFAKQAGQFAFSPEDPPAYTGGDERDVDGSDRKQKKKKKRKQKDEGSYEHPEGRGELEVLAEGENTPPAQDFYHRIGPRRDRGDGGWEEHLGKSGGRGKRSKNRKKIPEEWAVISEPFVPLSTETSTMSGEAVVNLDISAQTNLESSLAGSQSPWEKEVDSEGGVAHLSHDAFSPLVLNSDLKATAAPFTMPPLAGSFPELPPSGDQFGLLIDTENLSHSNQTFSPPFSPEKEAAGDMVDSGMFDNTSSFQESFGEAIPEGDTSAFSPASQTSLSTNEEVLASAPPLPPSDTSWLLSDSHMSSNSEQFDFRDMTSSAHPLPLGLAFSTLSPVPLRSPKTTAQEFQPKEHKDDRSTQGQSKKSRTSSSSSSVKSPDLKRVYPKASPVATASSPPTLAPHGVPGSGLNPAAKPFFPSFADTLEEPAVVPQVVPMEVKSNMEEENLEDDVKKLELAEFLNKPEQKSVYVEYTSSETPAKIMKEKEDMKDKVEEGIEADTMKEMEKRDEKVEAVQEKEGKEDKTQKTEESPVKVDEAENEGKIETICKEGEKVKNVEKIKKSETSKEEGRAEIIEVKDVKELHIDKVETTPEQELTPVKLDTRYVIMDKKASTEMKATAELEYTNKEKVDIKDEAKKTKEDEACKPEKSSEKSAQKTEKEVKQDKKILEKKDDKERAAKAEGKEKVKKLAKTAANGSTTAPGREGTDKKPKPAAGVTKPGVATKMRPTTGVSAAARRPTPTITSTSEKKTITSKLPSTTAAAGPKRPPANSTTSRPSSSSTTTARDNKSKTTTEKRPLVPKVSTAASNQTGPTAITKNGVTTTSSSKTTTRTTTSAHTTAAAAAAKRPQATKTDGKQGEQKKPSTLKTSTADSTKPKTTITTARTTVPTAAASRTRTTAAKSTTSSSTAGTVPERKPLVPRASRPTTAAMVIGPGSTSRPTARPNTAPASNIHNIRSKIGSTDNTKQHPGGGKVSSSSQNRGLTSKEGNQAKVQIVSKKLDFSHVTSRLGSKDNTKHVPGGGNVQILNKKVDVSKVTSKCGSKDNINHKPGGGTIKIDTHKVNFREQAQSKVGSMENVSHSPGGGNIKAEGAQETTDWSGTPLSGGPDPRQARSPIAHENGLKNMASSEGLQEPQALDLCIPETSI